MTVTGESKTFTPPANAKSQSPERNAGDEVRLDLVDRLRRQQLRILFGGDPREDAGPAAAQRPWRVPGAFQTLPRGFEHQPLLRLDPDRLAWGDAKEFGIESVDSVEESAEARVGL